MEEQVDDQPRLAELVVVPRSMELEAAERDLGRALVAVVAGTRPRVSPAMVRAFLDEHYAIRDASVRRHEPEDFVVRFANHEDMIRVLHTRIHDPPFLLIWHPWRRTSLATASFFHYRVLVALQRVPLHARSASVAQAILGRACARVEPAPPDAICEDDDREFFVAAWCLDPRLVPEEQSIFIPEPGVAVPGGALYLDADETVLDNLLGLRYVVRVRIVEVQDWSLPQAFR